MTQGPDALRRAQIAAEAMGWLTTPYRHQASVKGQGADCLGLVRGVHRVLIGPEPEAPPPYRSSPRHWEAGEPLLDAAKRHLIETASPEQGDVLLFRLRHSAPVSHCAIMLEADRFIHAYQGRGVITSSFSSYWKRRLAAVFSFPEAR